MPSLKSTIAALAQTFAASVLATIRSASLEEILAGGSSAPAKRGPERPRKTNGATTAPTAKPPAKSKPATKTKGGRLARRSPADLERVITLVVAKLKEGKGGLRSEELQKALKLDKRELARPIDLALEAKKITKKGQKRSTTYFSA